MKRITIGRNPTNNIVLNYPLVSGSHGEIFIQDDNSITLIDHSTNLNSDRLINIISNKKENNEKM